MKYWGFSISKYGVSGNLFTQRRVRFLSVSECSFNMFFRDGPFPKMKQELVGALCLGRKNFDLINILRNVKKLWKKSVDKLNMCSSIAVLSNGSCYFLFPTIGQLFEDRSWRKHLWQFFDQRQCGQLCLLVFSFLF